MEAGIRGRVLWALFVAIHPVLKKALPKSADGDKADLATQNDITKIRHNIRAIPLSLPDVDIDPAKLDDSNFAGPLQSLLEVLETLVSDDIHTSTMGESNAIQMLHSASPQEHLEYETLQVRFANLMAMKGLMKSVSLTPGLVTTSSKRQRHTIIQLARYIEFVDLHKKRKHKPSDIVKTIREFRSAVDKIFKDPIEALERNLGNAARLAHEETSFIQRAYYLKTLSQQLFTLLAGSITCSRVHKAQLHLSGFLTSDATFELRIADCAQEHWNVAKCRWIKDPLPAERSRLEQIVCFQHQDQTGPRHTCIAFDKEGMWHDESQDAEAYNPSLPNQDPTLHELILRTRHSADLEVFELKPPDKRILQILVACSLLNLDTSHWIRLGLDPRKISVRVVRTASDLLARWKPYIICPLQMADYEDDENAAVLSFGLLLMEMEADRAAEPKEEDKDWDGDGFSRDSMLKRVLEEWDEVDDEYKDIATACLLFRQLSERFYDPLLTQDQKRTGAMYKYILAPLFRLVTRKFRRSTSLFAGIPNPAGSRSISGDHNSGQPVVNSELILFDGSEVALPTQQRIVDAKKFMVDLEKFADKIQEVTDTSNVPVWAPWRANKIKIAIVDTGIDALEDTLLETALEESRIKECCGFVNDPDSDPDPTDYQDVNGHGTHVARLVLNGAPSAELFIAKISNETSISNQHLHRISRAIKWATEKNVNVISMSLGLDVRDTEIDKAIHEAVRANISIFCAAANAGGNKPRAYPAKRTNGVLCIHASDGVGNDGGISPTPLMNRDNFTTLGISIPSLWKKKEVFISGTSFATPIAAAFAADVLEFARHKCDLSEYQQELLYQFDGVRRILGLMLEEGAEKRDGYDYVMPFHLWTVGQTDDKVAEKITEITNT